MAWSTAGKLRVERGQLLAQVTRARRSAALCTLLWESVCIMAHMVRCATVSLSALSCGAPCVTDLACTV